VALTKQYVPTVLMHSNGVLLNGERAARLATSGLDNLRISIDGSDEETFQKIRGTSLAKIIDNLKGFSAQCRIPISTVSVISKQNWRSLLGIPDLLRQVGNVRQLYFQPVEVDFLGWEAGEYYITREQLHELRDTVLEKCRRFGLETNIDAPDFDPLFFKPFKRCEYPFFGYITLNYEGCVAPCCRLTNVVHMGDLKEEDFEAIWNGKAFEELRQLIIKGEYPSYCHARCNYRVEMNPEPSNHLPGKLKVRAGEQAAEPLLEIAVPQRS
jgi:MoaA/NifB/PqqE/SkfB family radical SAM enzyme